MTTTRCRAKNPETCAYHGNPLRVETQGESVSTAEAVLKDTAGLLIDYTKPAEQWTPAEVTRVAHLVTVHDNQDKFARDILKAKYDIDAHPEQVDAIETRAGSMYRYRMTYLQNKINDDKRSSNVQGDKDLADTLQTEQLRAEWEAEQFRKYAIDELHSKVTTDAQSRRDRANHEMARSIAASAQAFKIGQLLDNLGLKNEKVAIPAGFSF